MRLSNNSNCYINIIDHAGYLLFVFYTLTIFVFIFFSHQKHCVIDVFAFQYPNAFQVSAKVCSTTSSTAQVLSDIWQISINHENDRYWGDQCIKFLTLTVSHFITQDLYLSTKIFSCFCLSGSKYNNIQRYYICTSIG